MGVFHDDLFPVGISYGSSGGPGFNTEIVEVESGAEERVARWGEARHRYNAAERVKSLDDLYILKEFYYAKRGAFASFRYKDFLDFTTGLNGTGSTDFDDENIGPGDGSKTVFQFVKRYSDSTANRIRTINKSVSGTVQIGIGGVEQFAGFSIDHVNGKVTFTTPPGIGIAVTWGGEFHVEVRFGEAADDIFDQAIDSFNSGSMPGIPLVEIIGEEGIPDEFPYGGAEDLDVTGADFSLVLGTRAYRFKNDSVGRKVILPSLATIVGGGPWYYIQNRSSSAQSLEVRADDGTLIVTLVVSAQKEFVVMKDGASFEWVTFG